MEADTIVDYSSLCIAVFNVYIAREFAKIIPEITVVSVNPGFCYSSLRREFDFLFIVK